MTFPAGIGTPVTGAANALHTAALHCAARIVGITPIVHSMTAGSNSSNT